MSKYFYLPIFISAFLLGSSVKADTYNTFETSNYYSANRKVFVKVTPNKKAVLYKNGRKVWAKVLPELPMNLLVKNDGKRVVMIENYYGNQNERKKEVVIFFDENGNRLSGFDLGSLADYQNVLHTISNADWLDKYEFNQEENQLIVDTVVLSCPLLEKVPNDEDMKKVDECIKPKPKENITFSLIDGTLISRTEIEANEK